jgi:hypothetical protein
LAEADKSVARIFPGPSNEQGIWFAWIFARIWLDKTTALIESEAAAEITPGKN